MSDILSDDDIFKAFGGRCGRCIVNPAVCIHEIEPKSLCHDWQVFENRIPLCNECHEIVHKDGATNHIEELRAARLVALSLSS